MKFDTVYNEALVNMVPQANPTKPQPTVQNAPVKLDQAKLNIVAQKWAKAKTNNQPLNLTPDEMEAFDQLLGGSLQQKPATNTPPVQATPQASNKPQVGTTPAI